MLPHIEYWGDIAKIYIDTTVKNPDMVTHRESYFTLALDRERAEKIGLQNSLAKMRIVTSIKNFGASDEVRRQMSIAQLCYCAQNFEDLIQVLGVLRAVIDTRV